MKYRVYGVYCGRITEETIVDTKEEANDMEEIFTRHYIDDFGEMNYNMGVGDFCVYIDEIGPDTP